MAIKKSGLGEILGKQLVRSGTSVGAHFAEANHSKSPADFINKLQGARQEMEETLYWIDLCTESELVTEKKVAGLVAEGREIIAIMVTMTNNAKKRL